MTSSASPDEYVQHGKYRIPAPLWNAMEKQLEKTTKACDIQIGIDLSGSTICDWRMDGEVALNSEDDPNTRFAQIKEGVIAISGQALKFDDDGIEQWTITDEAEDAAEGETTFGVPRHKTGLRGPEMVRDFIKTLHPGGHTPLIKTLKMALDAYEAVIANDPEAKALNLVWFLDGVDDSMVKDMKAGKPVDLDSLKRVVMKVASKINNTTGCRSVRDRLGVQFCLVTSSQQVIDAYDGFDNAVTYTDHMTGEEFECDIFDCTTMKQVDDMGGWNSPLTHMKLIGGARDAKLDKMLGFLEQYARSDNPNSSGPPPSYEEYLVDQEEEAKAKA
ncbi:hypothetical protein GGR57DRAFT_504658 [Xylariaceae sp. FL1272]|nr:hypothetical protein GGR57DRAFT_504658 [Xylariaceae sp. FL1272]